MSRKAETTRAKKKGGTKGDKNQTEKRRKSNKTVSQKKAKRGE
jgi:hypothetical protein